MHDAAKHGFLASLLVVERVGDGAFEARLHDYGGASFGGDTLGRAALAASLTCEGKSLHSLHATFLRPVPPRVPVRLRVEALSDGRRLARRRVEMRVDDRLVFEASASFVVAREADASAWQEIEAPAVPAPETLPSDLEVARTEGWTNWNLDEEEFEWGFVGRPWAAWEGAGPDTSAWCAWLRPRHPLPDDPRVHTAALAFASDYLSQWCASRRLGRRLEAGAFVSLDHALHIHRAPRWDDWWLFHDVCEVARAGRTLLRRRVYTRDGALLASVSQEGLLAEGRA